MAKEKMRGSAGVVSPLPLNCVLRMRWHVRWRTPSRSRSRAPSPALSCPFSSSAFPYSQFTPTSASWLSAVEGWFAQFERRALYRDVFTRVPDLKAALMDFIEVHNRALAKPFKRTKDAKTILASVNRARDALPF